LAERHQVPQRRPGRSPGHSWPSRSPAHHENGSGSRRGRHRVGSDGRRRRRFLRRLVELAVRKVTLAPIVGQDAPSMLVHERDLHRDRGLGAVDARGRTSATFGAVAPGSGKASSDGLRRRSDWRASRPAHSDTSTSTCRQSKSASRGYARRCASFLSLGRHPTDLEPTSVSFLVNVAPRTARARRTVLQVHARHLHAGPRSRSPAASPARRPALRLPGARKPCPGGSGRRSDLQNLLAGRIAAARPAGLPLPLLARLAALTRPAPAARSCASVYRSSSEHRDHLALLTTVHVLDEDLRSPAPRCAERCSPFRCGPRSRWPPGAGLLRRR